MPTDRAWLLRGSHVDSANVAALEHDENITPAPVDRWATLRALAPGADAGPTRRQRTALAVVRASIGDASEQLEVLRRMSVGLPVAVNERMPDGSIVEHLLRPDLKDVRAACMYLIERRWGRARWAEASIGEGEAHPDAGLAALPDGTRVRLRTLAREFTLEIPSAVEKGHSPRDEAHDAGALTLEVVPVWPAQGGEEVPAPARGGGGGGSAKGVPSRASVGPLIEGRTLNMPEPLFSVEIPAVLEPGMPGPCSLCGHRHEEECEEYMAGMGRSCRCPVYVDPDVSSEETIAASPEMQRVADGVALAARAVESEGGRCGCGHGMKEHFATKATTRCAVCGCRGYREGRSELLEQEGALMEHFAKVAKRGAEG